MGVAAELGRLLSQEEPSWRRHRGGERMLLDGFIALDYYTGQAAGDQVTTENRVWKFLGDLNMLS